MPAGYPGARLLALPKLAVPKLAPGARSLSQRSTKLATPACGEGRLKLDAQTRARPVPPGLVGIKANLEQRGAKPRRPHTARCAPRAAARAGRGAARAGAWRRRAVAERAPAREGRAGRERAAAAAACGAVTRQNAEGGERRCCCCWCWCHWPGARERLGAAPRAGPPARRLPPVRGPHGSRYHVAEAEPGPAGQLSAGAAESGPFSAAVRGGSGAKPLPGGRRRPEGG